MMDFREKTSQKACVMPNNSTLKTPVSPEALLPEEQIAAFPEETIK